MSGAPKLVQHRGYTHSSSREPGRRAGTSGRSVDDGASSGSHQCGFVIGDDFDWHGFEQRLHAAFSDECIHEQWPGQFGQHLRSDATAQVNSTSGHQLESKISRLRPKD
jgi:hypothetical protein